MRSFSVLLAIVALTCGFAAGQSLLVSQGQIIQFSGPNNTTLGDPVPGSTSGEVFGGTSGPDNGVLSDDGKVLFRAQILQSTGAVWPAAQGHLARGLFYGDTRGNLTRIAVGGDPEPSGTIAGAILNTPFNSAAVSGYRISPGGQLMFGASIAGGAVTTADDQVLYVGVPGSYAILAREGDPAPSCGAPYTQGFAGLSQQFSCINASGQVLFRSTLGAPAVGTDNEAMFTGTVGSVQLLLRKLGTLPGGDGATVNGLGFVSQMNSAGWVVIDPTLVLGSGVPAVTTASNACLWLYRPGIGLTQLLREGDASPIANTTYNVPGDSWFVNAGSCTFNNAGAIVINADIAGPGATVGLNDRALIKVSLGGQVALMRRNDPAPGIPGAFWDSVNNQSVCHNDNGTVAFQSTLTGAVTPTDDSGIWIGTPSGWTLVVREGQAAPGTAGLTFGSPVSQPMMMNGVGQIIFNCPLLPGNASSIWSWDPILGLQALRLPNDPITVTNAPLTHTAFVAGGVQFTNGDARPLSFANDGTATFRVGFNEGSSAIMNVRIGSLTGVPGKISNLAGGAHVLYLNAGLAHAGQLYAIAGSASGTLPGTPIGAFVVPLNIDPYTDLTLALANTGPFVNTFSVLDAQGRATAAIVVPPAVPGLAGAIVHHAYGVLDAFNQLVFASEAARLEIIP